MIFRGQKSRSNPKNFDILITKYTFTQNWGSWGTIIIVNITDCKLCTVDIIINLKKAYKLKQKNLSVEKERSIDSKAQKKTNKITKFMINSFL